MLKCASLEGPQRCNAVFQQALVLLLAALIPAVVAGWIHPRKPDLSGGDGGVRELSYANAQNLAASQAVLWIDARDPAAYLAGHVPGAVNLTEAAWESQLLRFIDAWEPGQPVIVYCDSAACGAAQSLARRIVREFEATDVYYLTGGWDAWQQGQD